MGRKSWRGKFPLNTAVCRSVCHCDCVMCTGLGLQVSVGVYVYITEKPNAGGL